MLTIPRLAALAAVFVISLGIRTADADTITLTWDPNPPEEAVLGYIVYVGDESGGVEGYAVGPDVTTFVYMDAVAGQEYTFAVVGYNQYGEGESAVLSGFSNAPPDLVNPGNQASAVGEAVTLQLVGSDRYGEPVTYDATGLPPGFTFAVDSISGAGTTLGAYDVTVTVFDGVLSTSQLFTWFIDSAPPTVTITLPTTQATYATNGTAIALGGQAEDDLEVASVTWVNNRGGTGVANLTTPTTWMIPAVPLAVGENIITVTVHDFANHTTADVLAVTTSGSGIPSVQIDVPTSAPSHVVSAGTTTIPLFGTATDSAGITSVTWITDRGASGTGQFVTFGNLTFWEITAVPLQPGLNVITVTASNGVGQSGNAVLTVGRPPIPATPTVTASNKPYDGTTSAAASCTPSSVVGGDVVGCTGTATFGSASVGTGKDVTVSGLTLTGAAAGNYVLTTTTATTTAAIMPAAVTPIVTVAHKPYDGTTGATLTSCMVSGTLGGDAVACTGTATFGSASAGTGKTVTVSGLTLTGAAGNYALTTTTAATTAAITPRMLTPVVTASDKPYDRTTGATLMGCTVGGTLGGDAVVCMGTATFGSASVGTGKTVTAIGLTLAGAAAGNYALTTTTDKTTAAIRPRAVTPAATVADKPYDGTTGATLTSCTLSGTLGGEAVACTGTAAFGSASAGTGKTVTVTGITLTGAAAGNYALTTTTDKTTAAITPSMVTQLLAVSGAPRAGATSNTLASAAVTTTAATIPPNNPSTGMLSGTPTTPGTLTASIGASDGSPIAQASLGSTVASPLPGPASPASPSGMTGTASPTSWYSAWNPTMALIVTIPAPAAPSLVSPSESATAAASFVWNASANTTQYYIRVNDATGLRVDRWLTPAQVGCSSGTGVCTLDAGVTLDSGAGSWQMIAWNAGGYSPWSSTLGFVVP